MVASWFPHVPKGPEGVSTFLHAGAAHPAGVAGEDGGVPWRGLLLFPLPSSLREALPLMRSARRLPSVRGRCGTSIGLWMSSLCGFLVCVRALGPPGPVSGRLFCLAFLDLVTSRWSGCLWPSFLASAAAARTTPDLSDGCW